MIDLNQDISAIKKSSIRSSLQDINLRLNGAELGEWLKQVAYSIWRSFSVLPYSQPVPRTAPRDLSGYLYLNRPLLSPFILDISFIINLCPNLIFECDSTLSFCRRRPPAACHR